MTIIKGKKFDVLEKNGFIGVQHPGGVAVLPIFPGLTIWDSKAVLVRQRRPIGPKKDGEFSFVETLEIPAGTMDKPEESVLDCGMRELREETGYESNSYIVLNKFHPSPGYTDEILYVYLADDLFVSPTGPDGNEIDKVEIYTIREISDSIQNGIITDSKTIIAVWAYIMLRMVDNPETSW